MLNTPLEFLDSTFKRDSQHVILLSVFVLMQNTSSIFVITVRVTIIFRSHIILIQIEILLYCTDFHQIFFCYSDTNFAPSLIDELCDDILIF